MSYQDITLMSLDSYIEPNINYDIFCEYIIWDVQVIMSKKSAHYRREMKLRLKWNLTYYFKKTVEYLEIEALVELHKLIGKDRKNKQLIPIIEKSIFMQTYTDKETAKQIFQQEFKNYKDNKLKRKK